MKPGCWNQPRPLPEAGYYVLTRRYTDAGVYFMTDQWIPNTMSRECHQSGIPECAGCEHERKI